MTEGEHTLVGKLAKMKEKLVIQFKQVKEKEDELGLGPN